MEGAIICKSNSNINVLATGEYDELQSNLEFYCKIAGDNTIKIVNTTGLEIDTIIKNQCLINETFSKEFN